MPAGVVRRSTLILRDGRRLAYTVLGAPRAAARATLVYHHGWPSSAQEAIVCADAAARQGLAVVAFDRPGIGGSSYHPGATREGGGGCRAQAAGAGARACGGRMGRMHAGRMHAPPPRGAPPPALTLMYPPRPSPPPRSPLVPHGGG
jgi:pimeloyl-ACP methyl ester carboxylesterase